MADVGSSARCLVLGASGYVGARLVPLLLDAGHEVRVLARDPARLSGVVGISDAEVLTGDVLDAAAVRAAAGDADVVYHLVHSLSRNDFSDTDRVAAEIVADAAARGGAGRIVYLGGVRPSGGDGVSRHLSSRAEVGDIFLDGKVPAAVLQAAMIIGSGSTSFEMLRYLAERLPVLPALQWLRNPTQPIAISDVLHYLLAAADLPPEVNQEFDIGGPEVLSYRDMIARYVRIVGLPAPVWLPVPLVPAAVSAMAMAGLSPISAAVAEPLIESLAHPTVCSVEGAAATGALLPAPPEGALDFEASVRRGLVAGPADRERRDGAARDPALPGPNDPAGSGGPVFTEQRCLRTGAGRDELWRVIEGIGGEHGWYTVPYVWQLRGAVDRLLGGVGAYRGRRDPDRLRDGEVLDSWRVERVEPGSSLLLRAEMRMPGTAWLEMSIEDVADGRHEYRQRVTFQPFGAAGHVYWWGQRLAHEAVFAVMARRIVRAAERLPAGS